MGSFGGYWDQFQPHPIQQPALPGGTASQPVASFPEGPTSGVRYPSGDTGTMPQGVSGTGVHMENGVAQPGGTPSTGGGDYQSTFQQIMGGLPATPENLASKEKELQAAGIRVVRSGDGTAGKIGLPNGQIVDVIQGAHAGGGGSWQWLAGPSGGASGGGNTPGFEVGMFTGGGQYPLSSVMGTGLAAPWTTPFNAPDPNSITNDKALQWQMGRGMEAIQRSAAAKGTLLTGGTLKQLDAFGQGLGSTYYNDVYNRKLGEYKMAHDIFGENQQTLFNRLGFMSGIGENAAAGVGNTMTGIGNAQAAGTAAGGAAYGNAVQTGANTAGQIILNHGNTQSPVMNTTSYSVPTTTPGSDTYFPG